MRINTPMLRRTAQRLLARRFVELRSLAVRRWIVCPGETRRVPPAIHLPDALRKIQRLCGTRDRGAEMRLLEGGVIEDAATEAYVVRNVDLVGAYLYSKAGKLQVGFGPEQIIVKDLPRRRRLSRATLMSNNSGSHYFGNLLWDDMPLAILDDDHASHIAVVKKFYEHEAEYRELLGVPHAPVVMHARIDELTMFCDFAQNASKEARLRALRERIRTQVPPVSTGGPGIYIRRGATGEPRILENEPAVEAYLAEQGFRIIDPTALSAREIATQSLGAKVVVGVEGSHIAHALYTMADDATFLVLQPPQRFSLVHKEFADRLGMRYSFLVGEPSPNGFAVRLDDLKAMVEWLC
jgi:hypothetical protein